MADTFITKIQIDKVRHLENLTIELSDTERKHLILAGKNGSGKTTLLQEMRNCITNGKGFIMHGWQKKDESDFHYTIYFNTGNLSKQDKTYTGSKDTELKCLLDVVLLYIAAHRPLDISIPKAIETVDINKKYEIDTDISKDFLKYMIDLDYQKLSAESDGNKIEEKRIAQWFSRFTNVLCDIYNDENLVLKKDAKNKTFQIVTANRNPFGLNEMADGYSALLKIVMELMLRMESHASGVYDMQGIALIDEIETHLHVELQKKVLPFLTALFPNIQFIVTTHSPFVIESLKGAVVYDLERQERNVITEAKSVNETVREKLGVPITMPVWAEQKLNTIIEKYMSQNAENISFENMKKELESSGLSSFFPESMASILRGKK